MKEIKFTRNYKIDSEGNKYLYGYKCSNERFEIIKCGECYDVYEDGVFECIFYRLKDAKREIATRIKWLADEEIEQVNETTKQAEETKITKEAKAEDIAEIEVVERNGFKEAYIKLKDEYMDLKEVIKEVATEEEPIKWSYDFPYKIAKATKGVYNIKDALKYDRFVFIARYESPETGLKTDLTIHIQDDTFGYSIVDVTFDIIENNPNWDYIEYL